MHICVFTTAHPWDDVRVKSKFVDSWLARGDTVTWVGPDRRLFADVGKRDPRVNYLLASSSGSRRDRLMSLRGLRTTLAGLTDVDWVYCPDPDAAWLAHSAGRGKLVLDLHEEFHKGDLVQSIPKPLRRATQWTVRSTIRRLVRKCDLVTGVNSAVLDAYSVPREKRLVALNTPPSWFVEPSEPVRPRLEGAADLRLFHGKAHAKNGTPIVLRALARIKDHDKSIQVVMFPGPGRRDGAPYDEDFARRVRDLGVERMVDLRDGVPHTEMPPIMASTHVGLIAYDRVLGVGSLPNRFFEYLALGVVPVVPTYSPLMRTVCEDEGVGLCADFEDAKAVAEAILWCADNPDVVSEMSARATDLFRRTYAWENVFDALDHRMRALPK